MTKRLFGVMAVDPLGRRERKHRAMEYIVMADDRQQAIQIVKDAEPDAVFVGNVYDYQDDQFLRSRFMVISPERLTDYIQREETNV